MRTLVALLFMSVVATTACGADPLPGYGRASSDDRAALISVVRDYYDVSGRAGVTGDTSPIFARFPALAHDADRRMGVNTFSWLPVPSTRVDVRDISVEIEQYEPVRAFTKGDTAVVYVHGLFTWSYRNGPVTKGELPMRFDLTRAAGTWTIVRTDEQMLGETPAPTPR